MQNIKRQYFLNQSILILDIVGKFSKVYLGWIFLLELLRLKFFAWVNIH